MMLCNGKLIKALCFIFLWLCVVSVLSPHSFEIGDTSQLQPYAHGGFFVMVKTPKTYSFVSKYFTL